MYFKDVEPKLRSCITKGIRDSFKRCNKYKAILKENRVEKPRYKVDGALSKKPSVFYKCSDCKELVKSTEIQVDHIQPVIPLNGNLAEMTLNEYALRVFKSKCQLLCTVCHKLKSKSENSQRRKFKK